jgi:Putative rRNA methylase
VISSASNPPISLVKLAHNLISAKVKPGDIVIDATVGNGHDTRFLLEIVGAEGKVFGFDIQKDAINSTFQLLQETQPNFSKPPLNGEGWVRGNKHSKTSPILSPYLNFFPAGEDVASLLPTALSLIQASHATMHDHIPLPYHGKISAVMFNLGYLPGGDKSVVTQASSTVAALASASQLLVDGGLITVLAYPGHEGGLTETEQVKAWCIALDQGQFQVKLYENHPDKPSAPKLFAVSKISQSMGK